MAGTSTSSRPSETAPKRQSRCEPRERAYAVGGARTATLAVTSAECHSRKQDDAARQAIEEAFATDEVKEARARRAPTVLLYNSRKLRGYREDGHGNRIQAGYDYITDLARGRVLSKRAVLSSDNATCRVTALWPFMIVLATRSSGRYSLYTLREEV